MPAFMMHVSFFCREVSKSVIRLSSIFSGMWCVCLAMAFSLANQTEGLSAEPPRNVVFILSDDHRADVLGAAGHPIIKTPNLDRLASEGVRFENAFVTTSICAASRATLLTGLYERGHRYTFRTVPMAKTITDLSYPVLLRESGYRTGFVGKFGVGVQPGVQQQMFDFFKPLNRSPYFKRQPDGSKKHITDTVGDLAIEFLNSQPGDQPFCLSISFNAGHAEDNDKKDHYPWPPSADSLYEDIQFPRPKLDDPKIFDSQPAFLKKSLNRDRFFWRWDTPEKYQRNMRAYFRLLSGMDHTVGRILDELKDLGLDQSTVVIFCGDNGYYMAERGFAGKWSHYEQSLRVPLIIRDPQIDGDRKGVVESRLALNLDVAATILDASGVEVPGSYQGKSLLPLIRGSQQREWRKDFLIEHLMHFPQGIPKYEGVRGERWVYARYFEEQPAYEFLHDLHKDPDQLENLADDSKYATQLDMMRKRCDEIRDAAGGEYSLEKFPLRN